MANTLKLNILSPERRFLDKAEVQSVTLPGSEGQIQILPDHAGMIGTLETGAFSYEKVTGEKIVGVISTGFFEIKDGLLSVMAETVEMADEIDVSRAKKAQTKSETALQGAALEPEQFKKYQLKLQRALIRQQVAGRENTEH